VHFVAGIDADKEPEIISKPQHVIWPEVEQVYSLKLTRAIGVSNYNVQSLSNLLSYAKVRPAVNQIELHVYNQQPELIKFSRRFGIYTTAYSPLAMGGLV
jgi:aldehyde reductase